MRVPSVYCSPAVYYEVEGGAREFRQALAKGGYGHHQAIIYGNHVKELQELGEIVGFEVEVFTNQKPNQAQSLNFKKPLTFPQKRINSIKIHNECGTARKGVV